MKRVPVTTGVSLSLIIEPLNHHQDAFQILAVHILDALDNCVDKLETPKFGFIIKKIFRLDTQFLDQGKKFL